MAPVWVAPYCAPICTVGWNAGVPFGARPAIPTGGLEKDVRAGCKLSATAPAGWIGVGCVKADCVGADLVVATPAVAEEAWGAEENDVKPSSSSRLRSSRRLLGTCVGAAAGAALALLPLPPAAMFTSEDGTLGFGAVGSSRSRSRSKLSSIVPGVAPGGGWA